MKSIHEILQEVWGYPSFRKGQEEIIQSVIDGHDTLALLPTGGGKSICFQVPALYLDGLTIVISPLIALMKDQVERLNSLKIPATYLSSSVPQ
ncbi:MAG: DEAD/DEAH box helicase, partial [Bacteroidota bacterium]